MLPDLHKLIDLLANPAFDTTVLLVIVGFEAYAVHLEKMQVEEAKKQTELAKQTYELYVRIFETTEKRKTETREKSAATRAAKRAAQEQPTEQEPESESGEPLPRPPNGKTPPPLLPDEEETPDADG